MTLQSRQQILKELSDELQCPVLALVNGDRPNLQTHLAQDHLSYLPRHLDYLGRADVLALVLYTRGGDTNSAWPIVSFLREYCDRLRILVPFWAHSAGTLLALGADQIYLSRFATLSPIDPSVTNPFNPQDPVNPVNRLPISVEDVMAYFKLSDQRAGRAKKKSRPLGRSAEDQADPPFMRLAESIHPLALGNVQRSIDQIRQLAMKMIHLHSPKEKDVADLISRLTTALHSHMHFISRHEAREIGLPIDSPDNTLETLILRYYGELKTDLKLLEAFDPGSELRAAAAATGGVMPSQHPVSYERAFLETSGTCDAFATEGVISQQAPQPQAQIPGLPIQIPQAAPAALPSIATLEVTFEGWRLVV